MCCNQCSCGSNSRSFPFFMPVSSDDLARLSELGDLVEALQLLQNFGGNRSSCCNRCCDN